MSLEEIVKELETLMGKVTGAERTVLERIKAEVEKIINTPEIQAEP